MENDVKQIIELAKQILEITEKLKYKKYNLTFEKTCKNCGKKIEVVRKNINYCNEQCKKEYYRQKQHTYYEKYKQNLTKEELEKKNEKAKIRMKELRKLRKNKMREEF